MALRYSSSQNITEGIFFPGDFIISNNQALQLHDDHRASFICDMHFTLRAKLYKGLSDAP